MKHYRIVLSVLAFTAMLMVLAAPATATENKLLFVPDNSSAPGYGECVDVDIYTDINETDQAIATQFDIEYDPNCVQDYPGFDNTSSPWLNYTYSNPSPGICRLTTMVEVNPPISGHIYVGRLTLCCNATCCESFLNFTNALYAKGDVNSTLPLTDNGTFQCEEEPAGTCGDATGDGIVTMADGRRIYMHKIYGTPLNCDPWEADVTGDGLITMADGRRIYMHKIYGTPLNCKYP